MASVTKRGNSYVIRYTYRDEHGQSRSGWESRKTAKEAKERKLEIETALRQGAFLVPNKMTVRELLDKWIEIQSVKHKWAPKTYESTRGNIDNLINPYIGSLGVQEARPYHFEELYVTLSKTPAYLYRHGVKRTLTERQQQTLLRKWFERWQTEHPEYRHIVFHSLRHSSATYQLLISDGDIKSVQGNTGHAQAGILVNTYAHIRDAPRLALTRKFEQDFYGKVDAPTEQPPAQEAPVPKVSGEMLLEALKSADEETKRALAKALFA